MLPALAGKLVVARLGKDLEEGSRESLTRNPARLREFGPLADEVIWLQADDSHSAAMRSSNCSIRSFSGYQKNRDVFLTRKA
ncbi:MAG: hypothetical protein WCP35_17485 [Verrucomicrobiota bacterium]